MTTDYLRDLTAFTNGYIDALVWQASEDGEPASNDTTLHPEARLICTTVCTSFVALNHTNLTSLDISWEERGQLLCLTRNGHGSGYWEYGSLAADELTEAAGRFGDIGEYVGDDGMLHVHGES